MNKSELIDAIANSTGLTKADVSKAIDAFGNTITNTLKSGNKVIIPGLMTIEKQARAARTGRNPQTGQPINIPAKNVVKIKAGKTLADSVN